MQYINFSFTWTENESGETRNGTHTHYTVTGYLPRYTANLNKLLEPPKMCAGNPVEISTGYKVQREAENFGLSDLPYFISYIGERASVMPIWGNNYRKKITFFNSNNPLHARIKSSMHWSKEDACHNGWRDIQGQLGEAWLGNAVATFSCGACDITLNGAHIATLTLTPDGVPHSGITATKQTEVRVQRDDGSELTFVRDDTCSVGQWRSIDGHPNYILSADTNGNFQLQLPDGTLESYNAAGLPATITTINGDKQTLTYDPITSNLLSVTNGKGHRLDFGYDANHINRVTKNGSKTTQFNWGANNLISTITHPDNTTRRYHYEDPNFPQALTGITDERNVRFATWRYDAQGRAISSEHAGGAEKTLLAFNPDGSTTVTNALGKKTNYLFADILGMKRVTKVTGEPTASCLGANQNYTYNDQGFVDTQTDWKGNVTQFGYDSYGRETRRTSAFGTPVAQTTQTCWHPTLNQRSRFIEATKVTLYDYWPNGQLKSQTIKPRPAGVVDCTTAL